MLAGCAVLPCLEGSERKEDEAVSAQQRGGVGYSLLGLGDRGAGSWPFMADLHKLTEWHILVPIGSHQWSHGLGPGDSGLLYGPRG